MTRRHCIWILIGLAGCRRSEAPLTVLPESLAEGWTRVALEERPPESAPSMVTRPGLRRIWDARYEGPGKMEVRIYEMASPALSVDLVQRWPPAADTVFFYEQQ